jgi:hypothetical protein
MRKIAAMIVVAIAAASFAHAVGATIVPQRAIGGVRLGMTKAQVGRAAGKPLRIEHAKNEFGSLTRFVYPGRVSVDFQGNASVTAVWTTGTKERTARGVGVGSTRAQVLRLVAGARCEATDGLFAHCFVGSFEPGKRVTDFILSSGRVTRVTVGFVID